MSKRIIALSEKAALDANDVMAVDNVSGGTKKYKMQRILDQINSVAAAAEEAIGQVDEEVTDLKSGINQIYKGDTVTKDASGNWYAELNIEAGETYTIKNNGVSGAFTIFTSNVTVHNTSTDIESVGTLNAGYSLTFTATQDAKYFVGYANSATIISIEMSGTVLNDVYNKLDEQKVVNAFVCKPHWRNGSLLNKNNAQAISTNNIIDARNFQSVDVLMRFDIPTGYIYGIELSTYSISEGDPATSGSSAIRNNILYQSADGMFHFELSEAEKGVAFALWSVNGSGTTSPLRITTVDGADIGIKFNITNNKEEYLMPSLSWRNGSSFNATNAAGIANADIINVDEAEEVVIYATFDIPEGYHYVFEYSTFSVSSGTTLSNVATTIRKQRQIRNKSGILPLKLTITEKGFAVAIYCENESGTLYNLRIRDVDTAKIQILRRYTADSGNERLTLDYDTLKSGMSGNVNIAIQTDTHISLFRNYKTNGATFNTADMTAFAQAVNSIECLGCNCFANLGDVVRGYEFDPDYETRASLDGIVDVYKNITTNKFLLVGNHDDGCAFYLNPTYNDDKRKENVLFPMEQLNRISKYGTITGALQNYAYKDISGVRFISLYQRDYDYNTTIPGIEDFAIGSAQLEWLTNTALDTFLPVVVMTHAPLISDLYANGGTGFADAVAALTTFINNGGTVIAVLSGHTHEQNAAKVDGINHIVFANGYNFFELVSINLTAKTITCKVVNNSNLTDRTFTY